MTGIFQTSTPYDITRPRPLPGIAPLDPATWLVVDEAFAAQMQERERLLRERRDDVLALTEQGREAADELLDHVLDWLAAQGRGHDVDVAGGQVRRPDGVSVALDRADPLGTLGRLVQEDFCLLQKRGDEHVLTAAVVCFPASWRLADKVGRPLSVIHDPVSSYDGDIARRVQRLFDGVRPGRPLWRFNLLRYADAALFQPVSRDAAQVARDGGGFPYIRSERQCVLRLPRSGACVFSIHSYVLRADGPADPAAGGGSDRA